MVVALEDAAEQLRVLSEDLSGKNRQQAAHELAELENLYRVVARKLLEASAPRLGMRVKLYRVVRRRSLGFWRREFGKPR